MAESSTIEDDSDVSNITKRTVVTWADEDKDGDSTHGKGCLSSTISTLSPSTVSTTASSIISTAAASDSSGTIKTNTNNNDVKPLRLLNFADEGSFTAAVMDANINASMNAITPTKSSSSALPPLNTTASTAATVSPLSSPQMQHDPTSSPSPYTSSPASLLTLSKDNNIHIINEDDDRDNSNATTKSITSSSMGTNVDIAPPPPTEEEETVAKIVSVAILEDSTDDLPVVSDEETDEITTTPTTPAPTTLLTTETECERESSNKHEDNTVHVIEDIVEDNDKIIIDSNTSEEEEDDDDDDPMAAVILSPAWSEATEDPRARVSPSSSTDNEVDNDDGEYDDDDDDDGDDEFNTKDDDDDEEDPDLMTPTKSDLEHGIVLPPSMSNGSSPKETKADFDIPYFQPFSRPIVTQGRRPDKYYPEGTTDVPKGTYLVETKAIKASQILRLPSDSLQCIASFLTPHEWAQYGKTCYTAIKSCREVFRRVRMHGFRCATEVITAWKMEQFADSHELAALYIATGVPIYPHSLGHSYHTIMWRMRIEAKDLQERLANSPEHMNTATNEDGEQHESVPIDRFYDERNERAADVANPLCSYLEDKSMFLLGPNHHVNNTSSNSANGSYNPMTSLQNLHPTHQQQYRDQPLVPPAGDLARPLPRDFHRSHSLASSSPIRAMSKSEEIARNKAPKMKVSLHRHLLDQHLLGRACLDDENGNMTTPPVSLSADFFHPHLLSRSMSAAHSRPLMQPCMTIPAMASIPPPTTEGQATAENLLDDPAFQAWAARAAATVHNQLHGAALDDAEELAELQELYSQIFAGDRNAAAAARTAAASEAGLAIAPDQLPREAAVAATLASLVRSTVMPRDGHNSILSSVDPVLYSATSKPMNEQPEKAAVKRHLLSRFSVYSNRMEVLLKRGDSAGHEELMLDMWDEFFSLTAKIHYYDRHTAVPRISGLQEFLMQPCPKELGIVQCEIERVRVSSKKKKGVSMTGRLFPTYEYRLFIKDRDHGKSNQDDSEEEDEKEDNGPRRDTVLMVAKNRGRKHVDTSGVVSLTPAAKKGANNYYLYTPQQDDVDTHFNEVNETNEEVTENLNGASVSTPASKNSSSSSQMLLGRLQSNFIGTEFQIYTPKLRKSLPGKPLRRCASMNEAISSYGSGESDGSTSRRRSRFSRLSLRRNSSCESIPSSNDFLPPSRSKSCSKQDSSNLRAPRTNRRAIADATEATPDGEAESPTDQEPFLCEEEDGVITYTANLLGSRPRIMDVCIPSLPEDENSNSVWGTFVESNEDADDVAPYNRMLNSFKQLQQRLDSQTADENEEVQDGGDEGQPDFGLLALQNRPPWWNVELGSFVLNFRGRVSVASVKNFQLCDRNDHDHIMLQFGRIEGRHSFTMDYQYPLTAVQAFSIAISSLQSKISFG